MVNFILSHITVLTVENCLLQLDDQYNLFSLICYLFCECYALPQVLVGFPVWNVVPDSFLLPTSEDGPNCTQYNYHTVWNSHDHQVFTTSSVLITQSLFLTFHLVLSSPQV